MFFSTLINSGRRSLEMASTKAGSSNWVPPGGDMPLELDANGNTYVYIYIYMYIQFGFQFAPDNLSFKPPTGINGRFCSNEILEVHTHETCRKQVV